MAGPYVIAIPTKTQPITAGAYGVPVRDAILDLDARTSTLETAQQYVIKRARRSTPWSTAITSTETGILRLDDVPFRAGRVIQITTSPIPIISTVANDIGSIRIRTLTSASPGGTVTTGTGGLLARTRVLLPSTTTFMQAIVNAFYYAVADGYMSIMISAARESGTGNITLPMASGFEMDLVAQDAGLDPGNTGVVL